MRHVTGKMELFIERMAGPFELMRLNDHKTMNANVVISQITTNSDQYFEVFDIVVYLVQESIL